MFPWGMWKGVVRQLHDKSLSSEAWRPSRLPWAVALDAADHSWLPRQWILRRGCLNASAKRVLDLRAKSASQPEGYTGAAGFADCGVPVPDERLITDPSSAWIAAVAVVHAVDAMRIDADSMDVVVDRIRLADGALI
jgi:hypothetical protein